MINPNEYAGEEIWDIFFYHVVDKNGTHRFMTMNSVDVRFWGDVDGFERVLAKQFQTFELVGSIPTFMTRTDPPRFKVTDDLGAFQVLQRVRDLMETLPNSSDRLEPWTPYPEKIVELGPPGPVRSTWSPMSTLKQEMGNVDPEEIPLKFMDVDVCEVVRPEFVDTARARGGALLRELKEDVRRILEPEIRQAMEGQAKDSDRQDGPTAPNVWETGVPVSWTDEEAARKLGELRFSQAIEVPAESSDQQDGPAALDEGER